MTKLSEKDQEMERRLDQLENQKNELQNIRQRMMTKKKKPFFPFVYKV